MLISNLINSLDLLPIPLSYENLLLCTTKKYLQVWSGNEDCEPVTWNECKLVEYDVPFKVPAIVCEDAEAIPWNDCEETQESQMTSKMTCKPYGAVECSPITSRLCTSGKSNFILEVIMQISEFDVSSGAI